MDLPKVIRDFLRRKQVIPVLAIGEIVIGQVGSVGEISSHLVLYAPSSP